MLKTIALKNFVRFKNKTVISLDVSTRRHAGNSNAHGGPKRDTSSNYLNIFVGANFSGKSAVLELIRRCMTDKINASVSSSAVEGQVAYAFCEFDMDSDVIIISGIIKDPNANKVYKIIFSSKERDTFIVYSPPFDTCTLYKCQNSNDIQKVFTDEGEIDSILERINTAHQNNTEVFKEGIESTLKLWDSISGKYVTTFPLRGIGGIQWSKSKKIIKDPTENYEAAYERAEIISDLLSDENINAEEEKRIFKYLTDSEDFEFQKKDDMIEVKHNGKPFPLLKISEGIFEAKSTSLLLAHSEFKTLCLEDPDRGMHPQMIERLNLVLYQSGFNKTIIVVTHSPYFIDSMTIDKTHVFFQTKNEPDGCSVLNIGKYNELLKVADIEIKRTLLFATRVVLVEGVTDKEVVQGILTKYKSQNIEKNKSSPEQFTDISIHQIIPVGGCSNAAKLRKFCNDIHLPCLCILDLDAAFKLNIEKIKKFEDFDIDCQDMFKQTLDKYKRESEVFLNKLESDLQVFIWKHGALEDAILSSENHKPAIAEAFNETKLISKRLKDKLKERMDDNTREQFFSAIMTIPEIERLIAFIEKNTDKTRTTNPAGTGVGPQVN